MSEIDTLRARLAAVTKERDEALAMATGARVTREDYVKLYEEACNDRARLAAESRSYADEARALRMTRDNLESEITRLAGELERRTAERDEWRMRRDNARESAESRGRTLERVATDRDRLAEEVQAARATEREAVRLMTEHGEEMLRLRAEVERLRYLETDRDKWASMAEALAGDISRLRAALEPTEENAKRIAETIRAGAQIDRVGHEGVLFVLLAIRAGLDAVSGAKSRWRVSAEQRAKTMESAMAAGGPDGVPTPDASDDAEPLCPTCGTRDNLNCSDSFHVRDAEPQAFADLTKDMPPLESTALATDEDDAEPQEGEVDRLRGFLERIADMSVRPECPCGRPTGTDAIRACARRGLGTKSQAADAAKEADRG